MTDKKVSCPCGSEKVEPVNFEEKMVRYSCLDCNLVFLAPSEGRVFDQHECRDSVNFLGASQGARIRNRFY